jgi:hypothetical protein
LPAPNLETNTSDNLCNIILSPVGVCASRINEGLPSTNQFSPTANFSSMCLQQKDFNNQHNQCASLNLLLKQWATNLNVNHKQLDSLLKILKPYHPQ